MSFTVGELPYIKMAAFFPQLPPKSLEIDLAQTGAIHVIGSPNEGKSTFLGRFADACIEVGEGVLVLDPKGDLAVDMATRTRHPDQLIYIAPGQYRDRTFSLNVLEVPEHHPDQARMQGIVGNNLLRMFHHMGAYDPDFMSLIDTYLRAAVKTAYTNRRPTLIDVLMVLASEAERQQLVSRTRRPDIELFWEYYQDRTPTDQRYQIDSTLRRLWEFLVDDCTYFFVAHPTSTLHIADWLNDGKLVVINLAAGLPDDDAERMGNLIVAYLATQYRLRASSLVPWDTQRRWRLIVDEFWRFTLNPYAQIIRDGRSFNFYPVVAHQDLGQLARVGDKWDVPKALGHADELSFRRSRTEVPEGPAEVQREFIERQRQMKRHEADWTARSSGDTSTTRVLMADWSATANPDGEQEALDRAARYTLPKADVPSVRDRLDAWRQGGTMEGHAPKKSKSTSKRRTAPRPQAAPQEAPGPDSSGGAGQALHDEPDQPQLANAHGSGRLRLSDLSAARQAALLGGDGGAEGESPSPEPIRRRESGQ